MKHLAEKKNGRKRVPLSILAATFITSLVPSFAYADDDIFSGIINDDGTLIEGTKKASGAGLNTLTDLVSTYRTIASVVSGLAAVTMLIFMIINIAKLSSTADDPSGRKRAITGILVCGIAFALLGSVSVVTGFFWNLLASA